MAPDPRLDMQLANPHGREMLVYLMGTYKHSCRSLAAAVTKVLKTRKNQGLTTIASCSKSLIGNLRSGHRPTCSRDIAAAIEHTLQVPPGVMFTPRISNPDI